MLPVEAGSCDDSNVDSIRRYYFDNNRGSCVAFAYSGCAGNLNNFESDESCIEYCQRRKFKKNNLIYCTEYSMMFFCTLIFFRQFTKS